MVTLGSMHPAPFQQDFHGGATGVYEDPLSFHSSFELALTSDVDGGDSSRADPSGVRSADPAEGGASSEEPSRPPARRRSSILVSTPEAARSMPREGEVEETTSSSRQPVYRQSSAHRLFRAAPPEPKDQQQWSTSASHVNGDDSLIAGAGAAPTSGGDSRLRSSSWNSDCRMTPPPPGLGENYASNNSNTGSSDFFPRRRGRDDKEVRAICAVRMLENMSLLSPLFLCYFECCSSHRLSWRKEIYTHHKSAVCTVQSACLYSGYLYNTYKSE